MRHTRNIVMEFIKRTKRFKSIDFVRYLVEQGFKAQTAYNWLYRLRVEGVLDREDDYYVYRGDGGDEE